MCFAFVYQVTVLGNKNYSWGGITAGFFHGFKNWTGRTGHGFGPVRSIGPERKEVELGLNR